jgi:hypothetical protein
MALASAPPSKYENHLRNWSADTGFPGKSRNILENTGRLATYPLLYTYQKGDISKDNFKDTRFLKIAIFLIFTFLVVGIVLLFLSYDNNNSKAQKDAQEDTQILENLVKNYTNS